MKCTNCGAELSESDNFCPECGTPKVGAMAMAEAAGESTEETAPVMSVLPESPTKETRLVKWLLFIVVGLLAVFIAYKQFGPSVERAEAAARENRLDDAMQILDSVKGERADGLRAYVAYQMYISRLQERINTSIQNGSGLEDLEFWLENGEGLWEDVIEGAPQIDSEFYSMAEHNHQVQMALAEISDQMETAQQDMATMVDGVEYVMDLMKKGLDEEDYSFRWGDMKARMEECRQAGEQLAPIIEAYTPFTIEFDYDSYGVEISGKENCGVNPGGTMDRLSQIYYYSGSLYSSSIMAYHDGINDHGKNFSDNDQIYYKNEIGTKSKYVNLDLVAVSIEEMDEAIYALREQALMNCMNQYQFS